MSILVFCDHDNGQFGVATLNAVSAAQQIGGDIHVLVAGDTSGTLAAQAAAVAGVAKVVVADGAEYAHGLAENLAPLICDLASQYSHILAPATTTGKNIMPRVAALLDVMQISDIVKVDDANTGAAKHGSNHPRFSLGVEQVCLLYTSPSPRDISGSRMPSSA